MNMMKRILAWIMLVAVMLGSFAFAETGASTHEHTPNADGWQSSSDYHWFNCAVCGEEIKERHLENGWQGNAKCCYLECAECGFWETQEHTFSCSILGHENEGVEALCLNCGFSYYDVLGGIQIRHEYNEYADGKCEACSPRCLHENVVYRSQNEHYHSVYCTDCNTIVQYESQHAFDNSLICTFCGYEWEPRCEHLDTIYEAVDAEYHSVYCVGCKTTLFEDDPHQFGDGTVCMLCGYESASACDHADAIYEMVDAEFHSVYCVTCKTTLEKAAPHDFANSRTCALCGYNPQPECDHANSYYFKKDELTHYIICLDCARDVGEEVHNFEDDLTCSLCGYERHFCIYACTNPGVCKDCGKPCSDGPLHENEEIIDLGDGTDGVKCYDCNTVYLVSPHKQVCSAPGVCKSCGAQIDPDSYELLHDYTLEDGRDNWVDLNNGKHAILCFGCGEFVSKEFAHTYDMNTPDGACTACGSPFAAHKCQGSCIKPGICVLCGKRCGGTPVHMRQEYRDEGMYHILECLDCGTIINVGTHIQKCTEPGFCDECGLPVGDNITLRHNYKLGEKVNRVDIGSGMHDTQCLDCGAFVGNTKPHEYLLAGNTCQQCGFVAPEHECFASCLMPAYCNICGKTCNSAPKHSENSAMIDQQDGYHAMVCPDCNEVFSIAPHTQSCIKPGVCTGCGLQIDADSVELSHRTKRENGTDNWKAIDDRQHAIFCFDCEKPVEKTGNHIYSSTNSFSVCLTCHYTTDWHVCKYVCTKPGICKECGKAGEGELIHGETILNDLQDGTHGMCCVDCGKLVGEASGHRQTCLNPGICDECGAFVDFEASEVIHKSPNGKEYSYMPLDAYSHVIMCNGCGEELHTDSHTQFCDRRGMCALCDGPLNPDEFFLHHIHGSDDTFVGPEEWIDLGDGFHGLRCVSCGEADLTTKEEHTYEDGHCTKCHAIRIDVSGVTAPSEITMALKQQLALEVQVIGKAEEIMYDSSKPKIAAVDANGLITAKAAGKAVITIKAIGADGSSAYAEVAVTVKKLPTKITLPAVKGIYGVGESFTLTPKLAPGNAYDELRWSISDESIVTRDEYGVFTCIAEGGASIAVETVNGKKATFSVTVLPAPAELKVSTDKLTMILKKTATIKAEVTGPDGGACKDTVSFASSDPSVASVDAKGKVTAKKVGSAVITVSTYNGLNKEVAVRVTKQPKKITLNVGKKVTMNLGESLQITPMVGENEYNVFTYDSKSDKVVTVNDEGVIYGCYEGTTTVTVWAGNCYVNTSVTVVNPYAPTSVELNKSGTVLAVAGQTLKLEAALYPITARADLSWTSSNKKVATVSDDGTVFPLKIGTTTITVSAGAKIKDTVKVQVIDGSKPFAVQLDQSSTVDVLLGTPLQLNVTVIPETAETKISYSSSNAKVARVEENGLVVGLKPGSATITVKTSNNKKDTVKVRVIDPDVVDVVYGEVITETGVLVSGTVCVSDAVYVSANVYPATAETSYSYTSSNKNIATIDKDGRITALKPGTVTIKIKTANGKTTSVKLKIVAQPVAK